MKTSFISALAFIILGFSACDDSKNSDHVQSATLPDSELESIAPLFTDISAVASSSISKIVDQYLLIQNALANDDGKSAAASGKAMATLVEGLDMQSFNDAERNRLLEEKESLEEYARYISESESDIEVQRQHFIMLSESVYGVVEAFGGGRKLYTAYCPMVENNTGAKWLSETNEVKNPYYGASMLACGSIDEYFNTL